MPRAAPAQPATAALLARATQSLRAGRPGEAIAVLRQAASMQPDNAALQHEVGVACLEAGFLADAVAAFERAVSANPRLAKALFRLGMALELQGHAEAAIAAYRRATALLPALTEAHFRAGNLLEITGHAAEAIASFRRAATSGPKASLGRLGAARAWLAEGEDAQAERVLRQALALDVDHAIARELLATVLADAGRFDEAWACYERAIAQAPFLAGSYYDMVRCRRITAADADLVARMQAALDAGRPDAGRLDAAQTLRLHLAIGKAAEDLSDYAHAMQHFDAADALRSAIARFDPAAFDAQADRVIAACPPELVARAAQLGSDDATPVLILGMPRSGTTLVEQIVSSHPEVGAGGELHFWNERGAVWLRGGAAGCEAPFLAALAADYLQVLRAIAPAAARVTDKMPLNFMWAGLIHLAFPRATIIHCRRTPIDTALSIHRTYFNARLGFPTGGNALVGYVRTYQRLAEHWRRVLPASRFIEIDYESLATEPEPVIRRIVAGCGLEWELSCLHPHRNTRVLKTASKWQARQPIHSAAIGRWRDYEPWLGRLRALLDG